MYEQWIIALLIAPLAISLASFACGVTKTRTICTALHVTGLILMLAFALQIINGVLLPLKYAGKDWSKPD